MELSSPDSHSRRRSSSATLRFRHRLETPIGVFLQAPRDQTLQLRRNTGKRLGLALGSRPAHHLVKESPERLHVAPRIEAPLGPIQIPNRQPTFLGEYQALRFQMSVDEPLRMEVGERLRELMGVLERVAQRHPFSSDGLLESTVQLRAPATS